MCRHTVLHRAGRCLHLALRCWRYRLSRLRISDPTPRHSLCCYTPHTLIPTVYFILFIIPSSTDGTIFTSCASVAFGRILDQFTGVWLDGSFGSRSPALVCCSSTIGSGPFCRLDVSPVSAPFPTTHTAPCCCADRCSTYCTTACVPTFSPHSSICTVLSYFRRCPVYLPTHTTPPHTFHLHCLPALPLLFTPLPHTTHAYTHTTHPAFLHSQRDVNLVASTSWQSSVTGANGRSGEEELLRTANAWKDETMVAAWRGDETGRSDILPRQHAHRLFVARRLLSGHEEEENAYGHFGQYRIHTSWIKLKLAAFGRMNAPGKTFARLGLPASALLVPPRLPRLVSSARRSRYRASAFTSLASACQGSGTL